MGTSIWTPICVALMLAAPTYAASADLSKVDAILGRTPTQSGDVYRYGLPRGDLTVRVDGVKIEPALALSGWVAFKPLADADQAMMMGDLVLTESEIKLVMNRLLAEKIDVTALHNHLLRASPPTFYMHIAAQGDPARLARRAPTRCRTTA